MGEPEDYGAQGRGEDARLVITRVVGAAVRERCTSADR